MDLSVNVKSDNQTAVGVEKDPVSLGNNKLVVAGSTDIRVEGQRARGMILDTFNGDFKGTTCIEATGQESALGIWAGDDTVLTFRDQAVVKTISKDGTGSRAVFLEDNEDTVKTTVIFEKGAEILSDGYAIYADGTGAIFSLQSNEKTVTNIVGDVDATNGATARMLLTQGGTFTGATYVNGTLDVRLDNGAIWNVTGESSVTSLVFGSDGSYNGARLSFASAEATLNVTDNLTIGKGLTVVEMNELPAQGLAYITGAAPAGFGEVNAVMSGDFNDTFIGSTDEAVNAAADAVFGRNNPASRKVTEVFFEEGRIEGAVEARRKEDGTFTVVRRANEKMEAVKTLSVLAALQWRRDMNDLTKRIGELRTSPEGIGSWARAYGSEQSYGGLDMKNASVQAGTDADVGMGWKAGAAFHYTDGSGDMTNGSADSKAWGLAAYGTWLGEGGRFVDLIARVSRLETDYVVKGTTGSFSNNAFSLSAEYGRHFKLVGGGFVEPQLEVSWGRIMGDDFLNSDGVRIDQDDFDSLIGRMGLRAGLSFPKDKGLVYARASVLHDFKGEGEAFASLGEKRVLLSDDVGGTWAEFGIGANFHLTPATSTYVDLERTTGGEMNEKWRWNVGARHVF